MTKASFACQSFTTKVNEKQLPLLQIVRNAFPFAILDDTYIICAQHLLETSAILFYNLFQLGLDPNHFSVIGKCYSTNPSVFFNLKIIKCLDICDSSIKFSPGQSYDTQYKNDVINFLHLRLEKILTSGCGKLIVVDDGGELIQAVNQLVKSNILPKDMQIVGVEQTSSGFAKLQGLDLSISIINVARSNVKLSLESSLIADAIIKNLWMALEEIELRPTKTLVLGKGAIGSKVEEKLSLYFDVDSYDPLINKSAIRHYEDIDFSIYDLIIGCSGKEAMNFSDFRFLRKKAILASGSSSDREFCGAAFRTQLDSVPRCHDHIMANEIYLLNCGFPINFSKHYDLVDDDRYQLTRSLILAGILEANTNTPLSTSFIDLSSTIQKIITEQFFSLYPSYEKG